MRLPSGVRRASTNCRDYLLVLADLPFAFFVGANGRYPIRFAVCMFAFSFYVFSFRIG